MGAIVSRVTRELYCGATVINEYHALTAAHCVNSNNRNASQILLLVGDHDYTTGGCENCNLEQFGVLELGGSSMTATGT